MKKILLFAAMFAVGFSSYAQNEDFNDSYPAGWIVNRDLKLAKYDNPLTGMVDTGMVTAQINIGPTPNTGLHLFTTAPAAYTATSSTVNVSFDAFAFKGATRNFNASDYENKFKCNTQVRAYLVPASYSSTAIPTGSNVLGQSSYVVLTPGANNLSINVTGTLVAGQSYRIFIAGRVQGNCNQGLSQAYVLDDVVIGESLFTENFNGATLPAGWDLFGGVGLTNYNTPEAGCANGRGLATAAITVTSGTQFMTAPVTVASASTQSIRLKFDLFAYNASANFECAAAQQNLSCTTRLTVYLVDATNMSTGSVPTGTIYGRSVATLIGTGANDIDIDLTTSLTPGTAYKLYVVSTTENCTGNAQRYVLDNVSILSEVDEEDFSTVFPTGWNFDRDLKIAQYCDRNAPNDVNIGLVTPSIDQSVTNSYLLTTAPESYAGSRLISFSFDFFAFKNDTRGFECFDKQNELRCATYVKIYLVASAYNSTSVPSGSAILGQSEWIQVSLDGRVIVPVNITASLGSGSQKLIMFGRAECPRNFGGQLYVIDNIRTVVTPEEAPLPVTFSSFTAKRNKNKVELTWETAMEENNKGFHVQRNVNGEWKNIGFVFTQAKVTAPSLKYSFKDANSSKGISQYRILQVDMDGKGKYSEVRSVRGEEMADPPDRVPQPKQHRCLQHLV